MRADDSHPGARLPGRAPARSSSTGRRRSPRRGVAAARGGGARRRRLDRRASCLRAACGMPGERLVIHGNNKDDELLRAAATSAAGRARFDRGARACARARCERMLVRVTPGSRPTRTRRSRPRTTARSSACRPRKRQRSPPTGGRLHVHVGSQLLALRRALMTVDWVAHAASSRQRAGRRRRRSRRRPRRADARAASRATPSSRGSPTSCGGFTRRPMRR